MTSRQAKLQEDTYFRVMRILQDNPARTCRETRYQHRWTELLPESAYGKGFG